MSSSYFLRMPYDLFFYFPFALVKAHSMTLIETFLHFKLGLGGGPGIINPPLQCLHIPDHTTSINVTSALANIVINHATSMPPDLGIQQCEEKNLARKAMAISSVTELLAMLPAKQEGRGGGEGGGEGSKDPRPVMNNLFNTYMFDTI